MENILPRREARENAFLLAFSQTFGDVPLQEALDTNNECGEERPVDVFGQRLLLWPAQRRPGCIVRVEAGGPDL